MQQHLYLCMIIEDAEREAAAIEAAGKGNKNGGGGGGAPSRRMSYAEEFGDAPLVTGRDLSRFMGSGKQ